MAGIRSRQHRHSTLAALVAATLPLAAYAAEPAKPTVLPKVKVESGQEEPPYLARESANPKQTAPLLDTAQTIQVIKKEVLLEQGAASLIDALRNTPGITMQLGENGNTSAGDTFSMRGFSTSTSLFIDGIRDLGAVTRDTFNIEQIEVVKGPAGADIGRGAASGYINLISKLPTRDGVSMATLGAGTANKLRGTVDLNQSFGETGAVRLNAMAAQGDVDERDVVENQNYAVAPSLALGLGTPTRFYLFSQHIRQDNLPDGGVPSIGLEGYINPNPVLQNAAAVDRSNFYGSFSDYEEIEADMITAKFEHDLGSNTTLRNVSRYGNTTMDRVLTGVNTGGAGITPVDPANPSTWTANRSRQRIDRTDEILVNQTSLNTEFELGGIKHSLAAGVEFLYERQKNITFSATGLTIDPANLYTPNPADPNLPVPVPTGAYTDGNTVTSAVYVFDTLELSPQWLLNGGLRFEHYKTETNAAAVVGGVLTPSSLDDSGNLTSWKLGVLYKPAPNGSIYATYANSSTPPGSANFALSGTANNVNNDASDPQETENIEIGTKWDLLNEQLSLTGALFHTENSKQASFDDLGNPLQIGATRVKGLELNAVGQLNNFWQITAGVTWMDAEAIDQQNSTGVVTQGVRWSPDLTATLWTSYTWGSLTVGGGARYVSDQERVVTVNTPPAAGMPEIPSYWAADAMVAYKISKQVNLRLNMYNLFDEEYFDTLNNGGGRVKYGLPRSAMLTAEFTF